MKETLDFIAYPFLSDNNGLVDHEILTDKLSSILGYILSLDTPLEKETWWLIDKVLHMNGSIRGKIAISEDDLKDGITIYHVLKERNSNRLSGFIYPIGSPLSCQYHIARCEAKIIARNIYLIQNSGIIVPDIIIKFANLLANILFVMSLEANRIEGLKEVEFLSKSY